MKKILVLWLCLGLAGCATTYHKETWTGGYTDMKIQDDIFKVSFGGNAYCGTERAENFALLRCAEVTLENGYKYFVIIDEKAVTETSAYTTPVTANTYGTATAFGGQGYATGTYTGTTTYSGGETYILRKPSARNTIKCFKEKPTNIAGMIYDAEQVKANIRKQYNLK